jgi:malate dehydrogenase (oxaloacetate-decarboxylating)
VSLLEATDLAVERDGRLVVSADRLTLEAGETLAVLGPNGAGKTSLLLALASLLPARGSVRWHGAPIRDRLAYRRRIAVVFQRPLLLDRSVHDNAALGLELRGIEAAERTRRADELLAQLGVAHLARRRARRLSGGEAQRVSIARALAVDPEILFLDEPFAALDAPTRESLRADLARVLRERRVGTILVTHDRDEARSLGDRVAVVIRGRIRRMDQVDTVFRVPADPEVAAFLGASIDSAAMSSRPRPVLSAAHRVVLRLAVDNRPGMFAEVARVIGDQGGSLGVIDLVEATPTVHVRDVTVDMPDEAGAARLASALQGVDGVQVRDVSDAAFRIHEGGKVEVRGRISVRTKEDLSLVYTPAVARVSSAIHKDPAKAWTLTGRANSVAIVSNGSAVLGLGDIGPLGALPVMEGKALLFRDLAGISAFPLVIEARTPREIVETVVRVAPGFGGINLEDIAAPACFEVERELRAKLDIPVFHDDQHGTAIVVLAGLRNAAAVVGLALGDMRAAILGAGAAGIATARLLQRAGVREITVVDRHGIVGPKRTDMTAEKKALVAELGTTRDGTLADALRGAHVFIGVSGPNLVSVEALRTMARPRIVFALANPVPEIDPFVAGPEADIVATGRSDHPNQVNNVLAFPGVFRGLLDAGARAVTDDVELAAADALAGVVAPALRSAEYILPSPFDAQVVPQVARAVAACARASGMTR